MLDLKMCSICGNLYQESEFYYNKRQKKYYDFCIYCQEKDKDLTKKQINKKSKVISCRLPDEDVESLLNYDVNASKLVKCIVAYAIAHPKLIEKILNQNNI